MKHELCIYKKGETGIYAYSIWEDKTNKLTTEMCVYRFANSEAGLQKFKDAIEHYKCSSEECSFMSFDTALELIAVEENKRYHKPFVEISKDEYCEMLECLPPEKWLTCQGVNIFRMSEYWTSNITAHYAKLNGKYFTALRRNTVPYETIAKEISEVA